MPPRPPASVASFLSLPTHTRSRLPLPTRRLRSSSSHPVDDYYALLLEQPLPARASSSAPAVAPPSPTSTPSSVPSASSSPPSAREANEARARIVFGSRLAGPAAKAAQAEAAEAQKARGEGEWIGKSWIPSRPGEPDNCCMSGCVNCVWDTYREDLEEWAERRREEIQALAEGRRRGGQEEAGGMDDDGGGSGLWGPAGEEGELLEGLPVGISEFMRMEKKLGKRRQAAGDG